MTKHQAPILMSPLPVDGRPQVAIKDQQNPYWELQLIGKFGLKTPLEMKMYLSSPAGEAMLESILEEIIALEEMQEAEREEYLAKELNHHRMLLFIVLSMLASRHAHADALRELIQQQLEDRLKHHQPTSFPSSASQTIDTAISTYQQSAIVLHQNLADKLTESETLETDWLAFESQTQALQARHQTLDNQLLALEDYWQTPLDPTGADQMNQQLDALTERMDTRQQTIQELLQAGHDEEAMSMLHEYNGMLLQAQGWHEIQGVMSGDKHLFSSDGERVSTFSEAEFIVPSEQKIVKGADGQHYLIGADQTLNQMEQKDREKAHQTFEEARPTLTTIKTIVEDNKTKELALHEQRRITIHKRSESLQIEVLTINNQLNQLQTTKPGPSPTINTPALTPSLTARPSQANQPANPAQGFRTVLQLMRRNPTPDAISRFTSSIQNTLGQAAIHPTLKEHLNKIIPMTPIPEQTMKNLLMHLERFGVDSEKPSVKPPSPTPMAPKPR